MDMRECRRCHRVGYRAFVPSGDYGWQCSNEQACNRRLEAMHDGEVIERLTLMALNLPGITDRDMDALLYAAKVLRGRIRSA